MVAVAYRDADHTQLEIDALRDWQISAARIDSAAQSLISGVYLWNNNTLAKDLPGADQSKKQIVDDSSTITSLIAGMSALSLPANATAMRATNTQAALAVVTFATNFLAAGPHSDADLQVAGGVARAAWRDASAPLDPFITAEIENRDALELTRAAYVYNLLTFGGVIFLIALLLLGLLQFRLTLRPIARLAEIASSLAAGRQATINTTNRRDEIGKLTGALAAWQETLGGAMAHLRGEVADSAATLSVAAQELASVTMEQTTAATATSATMEVLAHSSASIADTIDRVAIKADQTRESLELAQVDLSASGDRTIALASRVNEVEGVLKVINGIADQTNLLALNAAIEAARAGDSGRGFAVVADEVRRLAERTKAAAGDIAKLVQGTQVQTTETVLALEKGVKQMERGLVMLKEMAALSTQVQLSTQQQRLATAQVMEAIEAIADGSRSVATTAQDMADAAASQGALASDLTASDRTRSQDRELETPWQVRKPA
jgi:methyl-accepting chemotaxis protein